MARVRGLISAKHYLDQLRHDYQQREREARNQQVDLHNHQHCDQLTGLCRRAALMDLLTRDQARFSRGGYVSALLYIDLDNFKGINDALGHHIGDEFLKQADAACYQTKSQGNNAIVFFSEKFQTELEERVHIAGMLRHVLSHDQFHLNVQPIYHQGKTIIAMAKSMKLEVVAEGGETQAQQQLLMEKHCDLMQGFLLRRPLLPADCWAQMRDQDRRNRANGQ